MDEKMDRLVYEAGLAFFGRMAAGVSHELKNVLGILNELGGLMDDLLYAAQEGKEIPHERLSRIAEGINRQVQRGDAHIKRLHHFSHNVDNFAATAPLDAAIHEIVALCQRLANLRKARLAAEIEAGVTATVDKVFLWQHAIYECICVALEEADENDGVTVRLHKPTAGCRVEIAASRGVSRAALDRGMPLLEALAAALGTRLQVVRDGERESGLALSVPP